MGFTVGELLAAEEFPEMQLVCGKKGIDREIEGIRIIEIPDMDRYLIGGEILVTSLWVYDDCSMKVFREHLDALGRKNISGFIIKERKTVDSDRRKLNELMAYCEAHEIAVIQIPENMYYWGIIRYVMSRVFNPEVARLKYFKITHDNFNAIALSADLPHGKPKAIIDLLGIMLDNPIALYYNNMNCAVSTNQDNSKLVLADDFENYQPNIITKFLYMRQIVNGRRQYIVRIEIMSEVEAFLAITEANRELQDLDYMAIENAVITLQYAFATEFAQNEIEKKYQRDIIHNVLNSTLTPDETAIAAGILGLKEDVYYRVVDFHTIPKNKERKYTNEQLHEVGVIEGELMQLFPKEHIYRNMDQIVMIQKVDPNQDILDYQQMMEDIQMIVQASVFKRDKVTDFQIGIGNCVRGYQYLKKSYNEAKKALSFMDIARMITGNAAKSVVRYSQLGFFQIFAEIENPDELLQYVPDSLNYLCQYDQEHKGDLLPTLQTYLDQNQSIKKTSEKMFVHYRTVSYRIEKIAEISGMNFQNANEMLAVRNGLLILRMAQKIK